MLRKRNKTIRSRREDTYNTGLARRAFRTNTTNNINISIRRLVVIWAGDRCALTSGDYCERHGASAKRELTPVRMRARAVRVVFVYVCARVRVRVYTARSPAGSCASGVTNVTAACPRTAGSSLRPAVCRHDCRPQGHPLDFVRRKVQPRPARASHRGRLTDGWRRRRWRQPLSRWSVLMVSSDRPPVPSTIAIFVNVTER